MTETEEKFEDESQVRRLLDHGFVRLVSHMGDDAAVVQAARVSYGKGTKTVNEDRGLIRYLLRHAHTTPFEMVEFKFHCSMPMFVARQWIRHRTANVNEYSLRYSDFQEKFYVPEEKLITKQNPGNKQGGTSEQIPFTIGARKIENWKQYFELEQELALDSYKGLLELGVRKELARINLPISAYTEWYWKIDLHNLLHFLKLRMDSHAQYEIRVFADAMYDLIKLIVPFSCEAFEDFKFKAKTLSRMEQKLLAVIKDPNAMPRPTRDAYKPQGDFFGMSKREWEEFFDWWEGLTYLEG